MCMRSPFAHGENKQPKPQASEHATESCIHMLRMTQTRAYDSARLFRLYRKSYTLITRRRLCLYNLYIVERRALLCHIWRYLHCWCTRTHRRHENGCVRAIVITRRRMCACNVRRYQIRRGHYFEIRHTHVRPYRHIRRTCTPNVSV